MNKSKLLLTLMVSVFLLAFMSSVSAFTVVLQDPAQDTTISGSSVVLNATNSSAGANIDNCTFYAKSTLTANSSWSELATAQNDTADDTQLNTTFDSSIIEDANNYVFKSTCYNTTGSSANDTNTGITVDNTVPDTPTSLSPSDGTVDEDGTVNFSASVTNSKTTSCTLHFPDSFPGSYGSSMSMTYSGSTCYKELSSIPELGYDWYVTASDETNTTDSSENTINVDVVSSSGRGYAAAKYQQEVEKKGKPLAVISDVAGSTVAGIPLWLIGVIAIIIIIAIVRVNQK